MLRVVTTRCDEGGQDYHGGWGGQRGKCTILYYTVITIYLTINPQQDVSTSSAEVCMEHRQVPKPKQPK